MKKEQEIWTKAEMYKLQELNEENTKTWKEKAKILGKSLDSVRKKSQRTDWKSFKENPDKYLADNGASRKWTQVEMAQLFALLNAQKSYSYIAEALGRSMVSVERKTQDTDWKAWEAVVGEDPNILQEEDKEDLQKRFENSLVLLSRHDEDRLDHITEEEFMRKISYEEGNLPIPFAKIQEGARKLLDELGFGNPESISLKEGTYFIVGDSHGKFTETPMFKLLDTMTKALRPQKVIHIGHILDDDNDISYNWEWFKNLVVLAKPEELRIVQQQRNKFAFKYDIVRGGIQLGQDLMVMNQEVISDYSKTSISALDSHIYDDHVIVNDHKMEICSKSSSGSSAYFASPGSICDRFIQKTIKQIDFYESERPCKQVKEAYAPSFSKYRKMEALSRYWNQAMFVVNVTKEGHTIVPCVIKKIGNKYYTSYFNNIYSSDGIHKPQKKIFVNADVHAPSHDPDVMDIQEQICKDYAPDVFVNVGDVHNYSALNHHEMDRGNKITINLLEEAAKVNHVLARMSKWAKEKYIIRGNHERFASDFIKKFPQFDGFLDFEFLCNIKSLGYDLVELKNVLDMEDVKFIHGDQKMYGQNGNKLEKAARIFGENTFLGHIHNPSIRFGCFSIGLSGLLDQGYNEPQSSNWIHGFGLCNIYMGKSFPTTIAIVRNKCSINNKTYSPKNSNNWNVKKFSAQIQYVTE